MAFQLQVGGLTIDGTVQLGDELQMRIGVERFPRREGALVNEFSLPGERRFRFTCLVYKDTEAEMKAYISALIAKIRAGVAQLVITDTSRFINVVFDRYSATADAGRLPLTSRSIILDLVAGEPYFYSPSESTHGPVTITTSPQSFTVTNSGEVHTHPRIEFKAVGANKTNVKLSNTTVGQSVHFTGTILNGQTLVVDTKRPSVTNGAQDGLKDSSVDRMILQPGANTMLYEGPTSGVEVTVKWNNAFDNG